MESNQRDEELWRLARKRANFQRSLVFYFIVNAFLGKPPYDPLGRYGINYSTPWPIWSMTGWGIGLVFQYLEAYGGSAQNLADKEYEKT